MRMLEFWLLLANTGALLAILRPSRAVLGFAVAVNLLIALLHAAVEGIRYQMSVSYAVVVLLFAIFAGALINRSHRPARTAALRGVRWAVVIVSGVLLGVTGLLASALPVFTLPGLTGDYAVGVRRFWLVDPSRADPFLDNASRRRQLAIKALYPAEPDAAKPFASYFDGSMPLIRALAAFYQLPQFALDHLALVKTHAKNDLPVSRRETAYPVVVFSHGAGASMELATSQCEDLASHGYIVLAIDHTYVSAATQFPDGIVTAQQATHNFDTPEPAEPITQLMADDDRFVLDRLSAINAGRVIAGFTGKIDLSRIGVMGHSVGGAAAYNLAAHDRRVRAAINLDGAVYIAPAGSIAPLLMLANDRYHVQTIQRGESLMAKPATSARDRTEAAYEAAYRRSGRNSRRLREILRSSGCLYTIEGSDHMKFTDLGLFIGGKALRDALQIRGDTDPKRCLEITEALTAAFFNQHLKGASPSSLRSLPQLYPELQPVPLR